MPKILTALFILAALTANAAEIRGVVKLATKPEGYIQVAYETMTSDDRLNNMVSLNLDTEAVSKSSDFYAPRTTAIHWDPKTGLTFEHVGLPAGKYFVNVKNANYLDWKIIDLPTEKTVVNTSLTFDPQQTGKVHVQISKGAGDYQVVMLPLGPDGQPVTKSFHFRIAADVKNGQSAKFAGVKAGRYKVILIGKQQLSPSTSALTELGVAGVTIEAGKEAQVNLP